MTDDQTLSPTDLTAVARRRGLVAVAAGVATAAAVAGWAVLESRQPTWTYLTLPLLVTGVVFGFGTLGPRLAARRRLEALTKGDQVRHQRIRKAVVRGRADTLGPRDQELLPRWTAEAEPVFMVGALVNLAFGTVVVSAGAYQLLSGYDDVVSIVLFGATAVCAVMSVVFDGLRPWLRTRAAARRAAVGHAVPWAQ